ncbi:hypothetical protein SAMN05443661_11247 [Natronobacterium gregoryi]|uniref:Uncharacterized protein n=2 Tax=Natronobacterium gregoryi TaxID=44930 RepID=L0ALP8_NATGS|nr:hypothetical protein Natgr_3597 [Natronobacterium gregoryi SP2]ELY73383.1 hypothetical protein C490_01420 [Natronobacterium gregoryi SP2]SFJ04314.1 hypothetical protein SAMN05443661_11247 [Natronobacterium gregoryi]
MSDLGWLEPLDWLLALLDEPPELAELELEDEPDSVEYFVEELELVGCLTSVPKSVQLEQTSNFAPSTLMVFGDDVSAPHISH